MRFVAVLILICSASAQQIPAAGAVALKLPQIQYALDFDQLSPQHQQVVIDADGNGVYSSLAQAGADGDRSEAYTREFTLSAATRDEIFGAAKRANNFQGDFDYKKGKIAFTGRKTLSYRDERSSNAATFNWSENRSIRTLVDIFSGLCATLEAEPRLAHMRRFDKLGLDREMKNLEAAAKDGRLREVQIIAPTLREVANDNSVMAPARRRAEKLLTLANSQ